MYENKTAYYFLLIMYKQINVWNAYTHAHAHAHMYIYTEKPKNINTTMFTLSVLKLLTTNTIFMWYDNYICRPCNETVRVT